MARYSSIREMTSNSSSQGLVTFCASVAERTCGVYEFIATPAEFEDYRATVEMGWQSAFGELDDEQASEVVEKAERRLEAASLEGLEPGTQEFAAFQLEMIASNTTAVYLNPSPERALRSEETFDSILATFDFSLSGGAPRIVRHNEEPEIGILQHIEEEAFTSVTEILAGLAGSAPSPDQIERIREISENASSRYKEEMPNVASSRNWDE